jgi:hypothetical protein
VGHDEVIQSIDQNIMRKHGYSAISAFRCGSVIWKEQHVGVCILNGTFVCQQIVLCEKRTWNDNLIKCK